MRDCGFDPWPNRSQDFEIGNLVAVPPGVWCYGIKLVGSMLVYCELLRHKDCDATSVSTVAPVN